jgi:DNA-binding NarL/FixJ family response regulator
MSERGKARRPYDSPRRREQAATTRELILKEAQRRRSNAGIGRKLFLSPKTVESHVHAIFTKLDLAQASDDHRRVLAVLAFLRS